jgi:arsenate reductase
MVVPRVVFLCTGNSCRSQMAEGFLRHLASGRFEAASAGSDPIPVNPMAIQVMAELGIDISAQRSKSVDEFAGRDLAWLITVCDRAAQRCPTFPGRVQRLNWDIPDPAHITGSDDVRLAAFRDVRDDIQKRVEEFVGRP